MVQRPIKEDMYKLGLGRLIDYSINQSILKILLIIDYNSVILIMLIIPEAILFKNVMANNVQYGSDRKPF